MAKYYVTVVYPVYMTVEAESEQDAERQALDEADLYLQSSSIRPIVHSIEKSKVTPSKKKSAKRK